MSRWSSERAMLRDLRRAQGGAAEAPPRAAERPPRPRLREETEEEYYRHYVGDGDAVDEPDLGLIRRMLDMVRELNVSEDEVEIDDVAVISKLNPTSTEFVPHSAERSAETESSPEKPSAKVASLVENVPVTKRDKKPKRIRQRNVALESIFRAIESRERNDDVECGIKPLKLLKPGDLIPNIQENVNEISDNASAQNGEVKHAKSDKPEKETEPYDSKVKNEAVEKVNEWMTHMMSPIRTKPLTVVLDATNMFKKKSKPKEITCKPCVNVDRSVMFKKKTFDKSKVESECSSSKCNAAYVPSIQASQYYQKYLEKSQLMDSLHDDIWIKAEKKMKEIDEKKCLEAARRAASDVSRAASSASVASELSERVIPSGNSDDDPWRNVRLPQHRHLQAARCVVCDVLTGPARNMLTGPACDLLTGPARDMLTGLECDVLTGPARDMLTGPECDVLTGPARDMLTGPECDVLTGPTRDMLMGPVCDVLTGPARDMLTRSECAVLTGPARDILTGPECDVLTGPARDMPTGPECGVLTGSECDVLMGPARDMLTGPECDVMTGPARDMLTGPECDGLTGPARDMLSGPECDLLTGPECDVLTGPECDMLTEPECDVLTGPARDMLTGPARDMLTGPARDMLTGSACDVLTKLARDVLNTEIDLTMNTEPLETVSDLSEI